MLQGQLGQIIVGVGDRCLNIGAQGWRSRGATSAKRFVQMTVAFSGVCQVRVLAKRARRYRGLTNAAMTNHDVTAFRSHSFISQ